MNRKLRPTKSAQQIKDEQIGLMLCATNKRWTNRSYARRKWTRYWKLKKKTIAEKNKQLYDLKKIVKAAKNSYQEVTGENKQLKQYITTIKQQQQQQYKQQQQAYFSKPKKYKKIVYEEASDSDTEENQQEAPIFEEEIEEEDSNFEQQQQQ